MPQSQRKGDVDVAAIADGYRPRGCSVSVRRLSRLVQRKGMSAAADNGLKLRAATRSTRVTGTTGMTINANTTAATRSTTAARSTRAGSAGRFGITAISAAVLLAVGLSGCADTDLSGKVFDVLGVSAAAQTAAKSEPKMAVRSGLVLPPDASRLPEPGSGSDAEAAAAVAAVDDPDRKKVMAANERARLHKAYCSGQMSWKEKALDKDYIPKSPYGPCGLIGD